MEGHIREQIVQNFALDRRKGGSLFSMDNVERKSVLPKHLVGTKGLRESRVSPSVRKKGCETARRVVVERDERARGS